jgi:benzodiazapine receptor
MNLPPRWPSLWVALAISYGVAGLGGALTDIGPWYLALKQPDWKPPDVWFGPIWSTLFTLTAISAWLAWHAAPWPHLRRRVVLLFTFNALCNVAWSALFFALKRPDWALIEWGLLWLSVLALVLGLWRVSRASACLNVPYLAWVSLAGLLNWQNIVLNGPFA